MMFIWYGLVAASAADGFPIVLRIQQRPLAVGSHPGRRPLLDAALGVSGSVHV
jgi:hypothetical protein